ncbi:MAG: recombinase family protein [Bacteroidota bacterium]|nr:recombinase family protein [Bacteroidota bacterium]
MVAAFKDKGVEIVNLKDGINTGTATGRFSINVFVSLAEFEREIIRERTKTGLEAAKARGRKGGRPSGLTKEALATAKKCKISF